MVGFCSKLSKMSLYERNHFSDVIRENKLLYETQRDKKITLKILFMKDECAGN